jgi:hypothetical protein
MIEHPTKFNSKNPIILDFQSTFNVKNPKNLDFWIFCWIIGLYLTEKIQFLPIIQQKSNKKSKNLTFLDFGH